MMINASFEPNPTDEEVWDEQEMDSAATEEPEEEFGGEEDEKEQV